MAVKEFLNRALKLDQLIHSQLEELGQCRRLAESISGSRLDERVSHSTPEEASYNHMGGANRGEGKRPGFRD